MAARWRAWSADPTAAMASLGVQSAYGLLAAGAWLPLVAAYGQDPGASSTALVGLTCGSIGSSLVANLIQRGFDERTAARELEARAATDADDAGRAGRGRRRGGVGAGRAEGAGHALGCVRGGPAARPEPARLAARADDRQHGWRPARWRRREYPDGDFYGRDDRSVAKRWTIMGDVQLLSRQVLHSGRAPARGVPELGAVQRAQRARWPASIPRRSSATPAPTWTCPPSTRR